MKEIGKLLELLNEFLVQRASGYIHYHSGGEFKRTPKKSAVEGDRMLQDEYVLGKSFGFIKWLVENDKIDFKNNKLQVLKDMDVRGEVMYDYTLFDKADGVIMLLSISDTPIDDLLLYLK